MDVPLVEGQIIFLSKYLFLIYIFHPPGYSVKKIEAWKKIQNTYSKRLGFNFEIGSWIFFATFLPLNHARGTKVNTIFAAQKLPHDKNDNILVLENFNKKKVRIIIL